eukprot:gb/GECG01012232.1/.p1 GENE.gb/GECG01012232.1/~~gb/GECG01012232.1/.p1  ORF type:complete len:195 (+),score=5.39 gb/GECG01012232.1/:1-585(+)
MLVLGDTPEAGAGTDELVSLESPTRCRPYMSSITWVVKIRHNGQTIPVASHESGMINGISNVHNPVSALSVNRFCFLHLRTLVPKPRSDSCIAHDDRLAKHTLRHNVHLNLVTEISLAVGDAAILARSSTAAMHAPTLVNEQPREKFAKVHNTSVICSFPVKPVTGEPCSKSKYKILKRNPINKTPAINFHTSM